MEYIRKGQQRLEDDMQEAGKDFLILFICSVLCVLVAPLIWLPLINRGIIADGFLALLGCFLTFAIPITIGFIICHIREGKRFEQFKQAVKQYYNC